MATIDVKEQKLKVFLDTIQVEEYQYRLRWPIAALRHGIAGYIVSKLRVHDVVTIIPVHDVVALNK